MTNSISKECPIIKGKQQIRGKHLALTSNYVISRISIIRLLFSINYHVCLHISKYLSLFKALGAGNNYKYYVHKEMDLMLVWVYLSSSLESILNAIVCS